MLLGHWPATKGQEAFLSFIGMCAILGSTSVKRRNHPTSDLAAGWRHSQGHSLSELFIVPVGTSHRTSGVSCVFVVVAEAKDMHGDR